jgi:hypothetical protein
VFGALLIVIGALGAFGLRRITAANSPRAFVATAFGAGFVLAFAFHGVADSLPTFREQGRLIQSVPGARLVEFSLKPSLFFYADAEGRVTLATVGGVVDSFVDPAEARRLTLTRDDALALLRDDGPTFALIGDDEAAALSTDSGAQEVSRRGRYVLLANPAARRALAARATRSP